VTRSTANVVICGAGMAGISSAYHLAVRRGVRDVVLVDERAPLTLTSDKGTEAYRNWWPGPDPTMVRFMNRSIDLLEELANDSHNCFHLNRRGYAFLTANRDQIPTLKEAATEVSALGAGPLREHPGAAAYVPSPAEGFDNLPAGADLVVDQELIRRQFPFISQDVVAMLHVRRCGWLDAARLGQWLLAQARARGVRTRRDRVEGVTVVGGDIHTIHLQSGEAIGTDTFVIAAGPYLRQVGAMLDLDLPVLNELHGKIAFRDSLGIVPRDSPLMIWNDPMYLPWTEEERQSVLADETQWLLKEFPPGVHVRPRGGTDNPLMLVIWTYDTRVHEPVWPPTFDPHYAEVLLRGLARMIPGIAAYFSHGPEAIVDGGYYCKTRENRPLIGRLPIRGAYVIGALSGFGIMGSQAAADLLATHITGGNLPDYAPAFMPERYDDPAYQALLTRWDTTSGQL
jgi:sarcosine oxidase, subunit beta